MTIRQHTFIKFSGILFISAHVNKQTINCSASRYRQKSKILALFSFAMTAEFGVWTRKEVYEHKVHTYKEYHSVCPLVGTTGEKA
jgi:hypothetical protein